MNGCINVGNYRVEWMNEWMSILLEGNYIYGRSPHETGSNEWKNEWNIEWKNELMNEWINWWMSILLEGNYRVAVSKRQLVMNE